MSDVVSIGKAFGVRRGLLRAVGSVAWFERGCALEATDPDAAKHAYERAVAGRPDVPDAYNNLGRMHHDRGSLADAESCYRLAICGNSDEALYWFNLGVVIEDRGRRAEAIDAYRRALDIDPAWADAHYNLARLYQHAASWQALKHLAQYKRLTRASSIRRS